MNGFRISRFSLLCLWIIAAGLVGCASGEGGRAGRQGGTPEVRLASMLAGSYQAEGEGVDLRLDIASIGTRVGTEGYNLFTRISGRHGDRTVSEQGIVLR